MAILTSELQVYEPDEDSTATTNGGRITSTRSYSGAVAGTWPHVTKAIRLAGSTATYGGPLYRKRFFKVANDADESLVDALIWNDIITPGDDVIYLFEGTQRDTQADITGSERKYGAAKLKTSIVGGAGSTIVADVEYAAYTGIFADGDKIFLQDDTNSEELTISGTPSVSGTDVTITVAETIANSYTATADDTYAGSRVSSVIEYGDVETSVDNWVENSTSGTFDESTYPIVCDNIGTVEETWTLTFSSATEFEVVGDTIGSVGTGDTSTDFAPVNADFTKAYFTLDKDGWGGTWASSETIVFQTHPAAVPIWLAHYIPVSCSDLTGSRNNTKFRGEYTG